MADTHQKEEKRGKSQIGDQCETLIVVLIRN
jgi:hypothetical protein